MRSARSMLLALLTLAALATGNVGLRTLHLATGCAAERSAPAEHCDHHCHHHDEAGDDHADDASAPEEECATCELLLALAGLAGEPVPAPTFHAFVAVRDDAAPARLPAPAPIRALAARPPPSC
jgi:hypothetical protein